MAVTMLAVLAGCAPLAVDRNAQAVHAFSEDKLGVPMQWLRSPQAQREARAAVDRLLEQPLGVEDAVRIALAYSPGLQAVLSDNAAASATGTQAARVPNPRFAFERMVRREEGFKELEIGRLLSVSLLDVLLLPMRLEADAARQHALQLKGAADVLDAATQARQAWVRAVAAQQMLAYFEDVKLAAEAGAELARRMQAAGNFSRLQQAREQAFTAQAETQLARAQQAARSAREALVRTLGLSASQAGALKLPQRLPDVPAAPKDERTLAQVALQERLDVRMAKAELDEAARRHGLTRVMSVVNGLEVGVARVSETGQPAQKGVELEFPLPLFDFGDARRTAAQAQTMAAFQRAAQAAAVASSEVRESYGAYRAAHDVARQYLDELVPLRKAISEEMVLRYNGMLVSVFDLLADAREQIGVVVQAIEAQRDFWLADAALQAALIGKPAMPMAIAPTASPAAAPAGGH